MCKWHTSSPNKIYSVGTQHNIKIWGGRFRIYILLIVSLLFSCETLFAQQVRDSVEIYFRQGYSLLETKLGENEAALNRIADSLSTAYTDSLYRLSNITIISGSSPEGGIAHNQRLSEKRALNLFNHLSQYDAFSSMNKTSVHLGKDWQGLLQFVKGDENVPYRDEVIAMLEDIVKKTKDGEKISDNNVGRLSRLRGGEPYRYMYREFFPLLRYTRVILSYDRTWTQTQYPALATEISLATPEPKMPTLDIPSISPVQRKMSKPFYMALKTNMLYDAALIPNIGVEFYLGKNFSVSADWHYSWWNSGKNWYWRTYGGELSVRKWFGKQAKLKPLTGHHLGVYGQALTYDFIWGKRGYMAGKPEGNIFDSANFAAGLEYGYSLPIAKRLNLDFTLGAGYMWGKYYEYITIDDCNVWQASKNRKWIGPTKAEVSLVWLIGKNNANAKKGGRR